MKTHFDGFRVVTELEDSDIIDILSCYEFEDGTDISYLKAVDAFFSDFQCWPVSTRNKVVLKLLKKHLLPKTYKEFESLLNKAGESFE